MRRPSLDSAVRALISVMIVGGFFAVLAMLLRDGVNLRDPTDAALSVLLGALVGAVKDVTGFYLGSSLGSSRKDEALAAAAVAGGAGTALPAGTAADPLHVEADIHPKP